MEPCLFLRQGLGVGVCGVGGGNRTASSVSVQYDKEWEEKEERNGHIAGYKKGTGGWLGMIGTDSSKLVPGLQVG